MSHWQGKTAMITGAGSGIGKALALALAQRGVLVLCTDVSGDACRAVASMAGAKAESQVLDVRDATRVQEVCRSFAKKHGHLDFMFNNAGIGVAGECYEMPVEAWDRIIDINIRGVIHGVLAAYPLMVQQKSGHIINTASLAGLGAVPLFAPYSMSKHAVVGLTKSLRIEAATFGVRVSALCPAAIETPMLDSPAPADIEGLDWRPDVRRFLTTLAGAPYPVEAFVEESLAAIEANQDLIIIPGRARMAYRLGQIAPGVVAKLAAKAMNLERATRPR